MSPSPLSGARRAFRLSGHGSVHRLSRSGYGRPRSSARWGSRERGSAGGAGRWKHVLDRSWRGRAARSSRPNTPSTTRHARSSTRCPIRVRASSSSPMTWTTWWLQCAGHPRRTLPSPFEAAVTASPDTRCPTDGFVIDLSRWRSASVDPERRIADVEGGCRLMDLDVATAGHGLAAPSGTFFDTGIGGPDAGRRDQPHHRVGGIRLRRADRCGARDR